MHKANVCKKADGLFLEECRKVAADPKYAALRYVSLLVVFSTRREVDVFYFFLFVSTSLCVFLNLAWSVCLYRQLP